MKVELTITLCREDEMSDLTLPGVEENNAKAVLNALGTGGTFLIEYSHGMACFDTSYAIMAYYWREEDAKRS